MKQKVKYRVHMKCENCRKKAVKIAMQGNGVNTRVDCVEIKGQHRDKVVIIGEGIDVIGLGARLRKKVGHADVISVAEAWPVMSDLFVCKPLGPKPI